MTNPKIDNVFNLDAQDRYGYFIRKVSDFEQVFLLSDDDGKPVELGVDSIKCIPVWPEVEFVESLLKDDWKSCKINSVDLDTFLEWLDQVQLEDYQIAGFPNRNLNAVIVDPQEMKKHIAFERSQYD
jgi:hypothetical protein